MCRWTDHLATFFFNVTIWVHSRSAGKDFMWRHNLWHFVTLNDHIFHPMIYYNPAAKAKLLLSAFESVIFDQKYNVFEKFLRFCSELFQIKSRQKAYLASLEELVGGSIPQFRIQVLVTHGRHDQSSSPPSFTAKFITSFNHSPWFSLDEIRLAERTSACAVAQESRQSRFCARSMSSTSAFQGKKQQSMRCPAHNW